jgi:hypothetical protein
MKSAFIKILAAGVIVLGMANSASADVVYSNASLNGNYNAYTITNGIAVSDSFVLGSAANLTSAVVGIWTTPGNTPLSLDWAIGSSAFGSDLGSGSAVLSNLFSNQAAGYYDVNLSTFTISAALSAGNYWFTLQNAAGAANGGGIYWDSNAGPSMAEQFFFGNVYNIQSNYFALSTDSAAVPEPASIALFGLGLFGFVVARRKSKK